DSQYYSTRPPSSFKLHRSCSPPLLSFSPPERHSVHPADLHFGPELEQDRNDDVSAVMMSVVCAAAGSQSALAEGTRGGSAAESK
ncbi:hypothetical protein KUCAC02_000040, partial [Chaenocephalus aceratus]